MLLKQGRGAVLGQGRRRQGVQRVGVRQRTVPKASSAASASVSRGVLILPGLGNNAADYAPLAQLLEARGLAVEVAGINRIDWSRNAAALMDGNWWRGTLKPRPAVDWYLTRVDAAMQTLKRRVEPHEAPITVLTHSAGGWLGRVYLLDFGTTGVDRFVSLGSPHSPPPPGVVDQTRGILTYCSDACPGAFHDSISYVTIAGRFIRGEPLTGGSGSSSSTSPAGSTASAGSSADEEQQGGPGSGARRSGLLAKFAGLGYQQVCGESEVWGDFIVPLPAAHLPGALNVDLDGVFHSPLGEKLPVFGPWYGSEQVLGQWIHHLAGEEEGVAAAAVAAAAHVSASE